MDFRLTEDQTAFLTSLEALASQFRDKPVEFHGFALSGARLDRELTSAEFFDIAKFPEFGPVTAAMAVERLARLPFAAEIALSMLVRPYLQGGDLPRPFAVIENGRSGRFVAEAKTVLLIDGGDVSVAHPSPDDVEPVESIYAYPMGGLFGPLEATKLSASEAEVIRKRLRASLAAEAAGLMQAAIDATVEYLSVRKQFGRPLGAFQALRHRLAECAVLAGGARWLALKAAHTGDEGDAALAAFYAQEAATRVAYETHQMHGAIGMTLEHPLHLWTYRLKSLLSDLGGRGGQAEAVARYCCG